MCSFGSNSYQSLLKTCRREYASSWTVWLGAHDTVNFEAGVTEAKVSGVFKHYLFDPYNLSNDIALIKLAAPAPMSSSVGVVCLPSKTYNSGNGYVTGWGDTQWGGTPGKTMHNTHCKLFACNK